MTRALLLLALASAPLAAQQQVEGHVADAVTGEALARVQISLQASPHRATTGIDGRFVLSGLAPGEHVLQVSTVGYLPAREKFTLATDETKLFDVALSPATLRQSVSVTATVGPFEQEAPLAFALEGDELKNLASVLADDPLRAVQTLPGVTSNDDFKSEFALRGAGFGRIGLYLDGILLHEPFHTVQSETNTASLSIVNGDTMESLSLYTGPLPPQFADRTAGILDVNTREGSRRRISGRFTASATNAGGEAEGPLGKGKRGSWMVSARKSYLQYIISRTTRGNTPLAFGFSDVQGRASYELTPKNTVSLSAIQGFSGLDRSGATVGVNSIFFSDYKFTLVNLSWQYTPSQLFLVSNHFAYLRERYFVDNRDHAHLGGGAYGEWVWNADARAIWHNNQELQFGFSARRLRDDSFDNRFFSTPPVLTAMNVSRGTALRSGGYVQQVWSVAKGRLSGAFGGRLDTENVNNVQAASPYASVAIQLLPATRLQAAWGQSVQFPTILQFTSFGGRPTLLPERATHVQVSLEQRLGERTRLRAELYDRQDRDLLIQSYAEPRILMGAIYDLHPNAPWGNSARGYARGGAIFLQRRTANSFTGWISYAYGVSKVYDGRTRLWFPADWDLRHSVNVYGSYRLRPTVNLSTRWIYGSGLPIPGFYQRLAGSYWLARGRNQVRLPDYERLDVRVNKVWLWDRWQLTLFAEVVNLLNRENRRYETLNGYDQNTGAVRLAIDKMFPILPTAGITMQF